MDAVQQDMKSVGVWKENTKESVSWSQVIGCRDPWREQPTGEEEDQMQFTL